MGKMLSLNRQAHESTESLSARKEKKLLVPASSPSHTGKTCEEYRASLGLVSWTPQWHLHATIPPSVTSQITVSSSAHIVHSV